MPESYSDDKTVISLKIVWKLANQIKGFIPTDKGYKFYTNRYNPYV